MTTTAAQTATFDQMTDRNDWLGFGYLGARRNALDSTDPESPAQPEMVAAADLYILQWAAAHKWSDAALFRWANSKSGRWFGDAMFGGSGTVDERFAFAVRQGILSVPR